MENDEKLKTAAKSEVRETCLQPLQLALDSRSSKLSGYAIDGLKKLVTDSRFVSKTEEDEYYLQLTAQVLNCLSCSQHLPDDVLVAIMKASYENELLY